MARKNFSKSACKKLGHPMPMTFWKKLWTNISSLNFVTKKIKQTCVFWIALNKREKQRKINWLTILSIIKILTNLFVTS